MPTYTPTIIINSNPAIQISMAGNITYAEFVASLGAYVYLIDEMFVQASSFNELIATPGYTAYDASGYLFSNSIPMVPDPYQSAPSLKLNKMPFGMVLNGRSYFTYNIPVGARIQWILFCSEISFSGALNISDKSNSDVMKEIDDNMHQLELYEDFKPFIE